MNGAIEDLLGELERTSNPATLDRVRALVAAILEAHRDGLGRILDQVRARGEVGESIVRDLGKDRAVEALLLLHDLHPVPLADRVRAALDGIAAGLRAAGAEAVLQAAGEARVAVRIDAIAGAAPRATVRGLVERAIADVTTDAAIEITLGFDDAGGFVPVGRLGAR